MSSPARRPACALLNPITYSKMELLLTPLVNRILRSVVKSSEEGTGASLKASVSGSGGIYLTNLELNLDPLLQGVPWLAPKRAFAKQLRITIPWKALTTQPIQVRDGRQHALKLWAGAGQRRHRPHPVPSALRAGGP